MSEFAPAEPSAALSNPPEIERNQAALVADFCRAGSAGLIAREFLGQVRERLFERHRAGAGGFEIVTAYTAAMDCLIRAIYEFADISQGRKFPRLNQRLTVIARGGYGRAELSPHSDIDLIFLHDYRPGPYFEVVTETILHVLFDTHLEIGYAVRNVNECVKMAATDLKEKTAILDTRYLAGDAKIYAQLEKAVAAEVLNKDQRNFFKAKLAESEERHHRFGDSVYLLEPNLKEGEGGLRDLHTAMWLAKAKYKIHNVAELVQKAVITEEECDAIKAAQDFMFRVRNSLHFVSRRHFDQLTFELQEQIAPILGFTDTEGVSASARLMRQYYQQATAILRFSEVLIDRVADEVTRSRLPWRRTTRQIRPGVVIQERNLGLSDPDFFRRAPLNLVTIFADCQAHDAQLAGSTYQAVRDNLHLAEALPYDPNVGLALTGILSSPDRVASTLEAMHRAGVLGAIIPEFGALDGRVVHDLYHIYTVDRHSLAGVRELEQLRAGKFKESNPRLTEAARDYDALPLVYLALLLHDVGKGYGHDHDKRGALLAAQICTRLGLDSEASDLVVFLVRNHLMMSAVAQKGDIDDTRTIDEFARQVGCIDRLKALYLMTFADMRAVAPKIYSNWRDMLLSDLYLKALKLLEQGDKEAVEPQRRLSLVKAQVRNQLEAGDDAHRDVDHFLESMPDRYFLTTPEADIIHHFEVMRTLSEERPLACRHRVFPQLEFAELVVVTPDQSGLFAKIAGVLTANNLNILSARINTSSDNLALDVFRVSLGTGGVALEADRWLKVERDLERVLRGDQDVVEMVNSALHNLPGGRKFTRRMATEVTVDNKTSEQFTILDVFSPDRVGLLFTITYSLFELDYVIHLARISTTADQALDVFYITDQRGHKVKDSEQLQRLKSILSEKLEPSNASRFSPSAPQ